MSRGSGPILAHVAAPHKATTWVVSTVYYSPRCNIYRLEFFPCSSPIVTGTSVLAIKYKDGVMIASDTQGLYYTLFHFCRLSHEPYDHLANVLWVAIGLSFLSDTGSYGSLARYTELRRIRRVGDYTMVAASGEYSDFQYIMDNLSELVSAKCY